MYKYDFRDLHERPRYLPGLETEFGGVNLDQKYLGGFTTLNVSGRGLLAPDIKTTAKVGAPGLWVDSSDLPAREIEVEVLLQGDDLRELYNRLNADLNRQIDKVQELRFSDEGEYFYRALFKGVSEPKEDRDSLICSLTFICPDPYKYGAKEILSGQGRIKYLKSYLWPSKIERVELTNPGASEIRVGLASTGQYLRLVGSESLSLRDKRKILFDFESGEIKADGANALSLLTLDSDFEGLELDHGAELVCSNPRALITITYRERVL